MKRKGRSAARTASDQAEREVGTFDKPHHTIPCTLATMPPNPATWLFCAFQHRKDTLCPVARPG